MPSPALHVAVCTHNPDPTRLKRTLESLAAQTLPMERWNFTLVDNASSVPLEGVCDLSWHPRGRVVREERLGLTEARLRAIEATDEDLLVFVDDDNVLSPDYLEQVLELDRQWPQLGVWGAGKILPEFEVEPPEFLSSEHYPMLALRDEERDCWSSNPGSGAIPWGAGLVVRRSLAEKYHELVSSSELRRELDRRGEILNSAGDDEFSWVAAEELQLGHGVFAAMKLTHLIPASRLEEEYLLRLAEGHAFSRSMLHHLHGSTVPGLWVPSWRVVFTGLIASRNPLRQRVQDFAENVAVKMRVGRLRGHPLRLREARAAGSARAGRQISKAS